MNIEEQNILLQEKIDLLSLQNEQLKKRISSLQTLLDSDIRKFFQISNSIKQTKKRFCYETIRECYDDLVYFYGSTDPVQNADDYKECYKQIFGVDYQNNNYNDTTIPIINEDVFQSIFNTLIENIFECVSDDLDVDLENDLEVD